MGQHICLLGSELARLAEYCPVIHRAETDNRRLKDRLPIIRHQPLPPDHHPQPWVFLQHGAAYDRANLHHRCDSGGSLRVHIGPRGQAQPLHHWVPAYDDNWILYVSPSTTLTIASSKERVLCDFTNLAKVYIDHEPAGHLWWCLRGRLRHLPGVSGHHRMASQQSGGQLQTQRGHGTTDRRGQPGRRDGVQLLPAEGLTALRPRPRTRARLHLCWYPCRHYPGSRLHPHQ